MKPVRFRCRKYLFGVGQESLPAGSSGILPPVEHSGQGCPENRQPRWLPYICGRNAKNILSKAGWCMS